MAAVGKAQALAVVLLKKDDSFYGGLIRMRTGLHMMHKIVMTRLLCLRLALEY